MVELNRAVAGGHGAGGRRAGLALVDGLLEEPRLAGYPWLPSVRGDLLARLGRHAEARREFRARAAGLTHNARDRARCCCWRGRRPRERPPAPSRRRPSSRCWRWPACSGGNHVAARLALDHGVNVVTAVAVRSLATAAVVALVVALQHVPVRLAPRHWKVMPVIGLLVTLQSALLYSAVARIPVGLALLAFNTYPLWTALAAFALYRPTAPSARVLMAMPVILLGLGLALDITGMASGLAAAAQWDRIGTGVVFAVAAAAAFGLVLGADPARGWPIWNGRVRTVISMAIVGALALGCRAGPAAACTGPRRRSGWWGLALLRRALRQPHSRCCSRCCPSWGVVGNSPILNVEPVAALLMAWALLGQTIAPAAVGRLAAGGGRGDEPGGSSAPLTPPPSGRPGPRPRSPGAPARACARSSA